MMWGKKKLQMGWQKIQNIVFNLLNMSKSIGWSPCPHTSMTSSQAHSCQVVWDANNIIAHVRRVVVVSCPTMKKVLQLSINGCMPKWTFPPLIVVSSIVALSMRPNKSFPYEVLLALFTISFYDWIICFKELEMEIWVKIILIFTNVGRRL